MIWLLNELPPAAYPAVGGKARVLAQLAQQGYPVPAGFVIGPEAFATGELHPRIHLLVLDKVAGLRRRDGASAFAVRSSAVSEDSAAASFAGEFETILDVSTDEEIRQAIQIVYQSRLSQRVDAYTRAQGLEGEHQMAVIVQEMIPAELAGVLFTADPVSGDQRRMIGDFVRGLGDKLVSGDSGGQHFTMEQPSGAYAGPAELKPFAARLFKLGQRLAREFAGPQDIEWAIAGGELYVLQSRPITTMQPYDSRTGEWNDSKRGDYLWSNANFGEAFPSVMTPLTWSLVQIYGEETFGDPLPGNNPLFGNIAGRLYINLSLFASMMGALGFSRERINRESEEFFGNLPDDIEVPIIPFSRWAVLRRFVPFAVRAALRRQRNLRQLDTFTARMPERVDRLDQVVRSVGSPQTLTQLWAERLEPLVRRAFQMLQAGTSKYENAYRSLHRTLVDRVGEEKANLLLSGVSADGEQLASLGPMVGLWQVSQGEMSHEDYLQKYGHRGLDEFEVFWPRPVEDPEWLDRQLATQANVNVPALLANREAEKQAAWSMYSEQYPKQADKMARKLAAASEAARGREAIRSEIARLFALVRTFALRAGVLTGLGDGVFFLTYEELVAVLGGSGDGCEQIDIRRQAYERLSSLPPYPALIRGRFDPHAWAADPNRRSDLYDAVGLEPEGADFRADLVQGMPGSAGEVEGVVRVINDLKDGHHLQAGEILVTVTTNVGWTPLFPKAAAIVTDVGAPLSHAAIVARELGIPAVIGAGDATMRLQTGDLVRVNGARGTVERIRGA